MFWFVEIYNREYFIQKINPFKKGKTTLEAPVDPEPLVEFTVEGAKKDLLAQINQTLIDNDIPEITMVQLDRLTSSMEPSSEASKYTLLRKYIRITKGEKKSKKVEAIESDEVDEKNKSVEYDFEGRFSALETRLNQLVEENRELRGRIEIAQKNNSGNRLNTEIQTLRANQDVFRENQETFRKNQETFRVRFNNLCLVNNLIKT